MDVPYWEFSGTTVVTSSYIRLTPDRQSKQGMLWNVVVRKLYMCVNAWCVNQHQP